MMGPVMAQARRRSQHGRPRRGLVRLGWPMVLGLLVFTLGTAVLAAAWTLGGRSSGQLSSVEELVSPKGGRSAGPAPSSDVGTSATGDDAAVEVGSNTSAEDAASPAPAVEGEKRASGALLPVGLHDSHRQDGRMTTLPGAAAPLTARGVPLEQLPALDDLGWNVGELHGLGRSMTPERVLTGRAEGVRTVQVRHTDGAHQVTVAETRPVDESTALRPLAEKLDDLLDLEAVEQRRITLSSGEDCTVYRAAGRDRWTAAVDGGGAQYVITSDLDDTTVDSVVSWVMVTDRSRVRSMPQSSDAGDRLERGFRSMLDWLD